MSTDEMSKFGKAGMDTAMTSLGAWTKNAQAIAVEVADYSRKSFAGSAAAWERLLGAKTLEKAIEVQNDYLKSSYEDFVASATKLGEMYVDFARDACKPLEGAFAQAASIK